MKLLVATRSPGKLGELSALLGPRGYELLDLESAGIARRSDEESIERFDSFEENALAKARYFAAMSEGLPIVADDSGLMVTALGGEPGVRSKRWSGRTGAPTRDACSTRRSAIPDVILRGSRATR